ncbi:creatininase family protein (plasmid) [Xanthobacter dioxanivorans]|uniref:Creatininase family protein n=1 Tax=Xanthobacter dioxanivorans TaxID=2528964 RepID=A0A974PV94_9HYPH|nr:creatininase family protein [Xanthobacter dioxanivorans]
MIRDIIAGLGRHGIKRVVVVVGHFENMWAAIEGIDLALRELRRDGVHDMTVVRLEYWDLVHQETSDKIFPGGFPRTELEHAALLETSMMLVARPDMVDLTKVPSDGPAKVPSCDRYPVGAGKIPTSGVLARAERSSAQIRHWLFQDHVALVEAAVREALVLDADGRD